MKILFLIALLIFSARAAFADIEYKSLSAVDPANTAIFSSLVDCLPPFAQDVKVRQQELNRSLLDVPKFLPDVFGWIYHYSWIAKDIKDYPTPEFIKTIDAQIYPYYKKITIEVTFSEPMKSATVDYLYNENYSKPSGQAQTKTASKDGQKSFVFTLDLPLDFTSENIPHSFINFSE